MARPRNARFSRAAMRTDGERLRTSAAAARSAAKWFVPPRKKSYIRAGCGLELSISAGRSDMSASLAVIRNRIAVGGRSGRWITDATGKVLLVSGVNMVNKRTPYTPAADGFGSADAAFLAANGLDAVRVGVLWEACLLYTSDAADDLLC